MYASLESLVARTLAIASLATLTGCGLLGGSYQSPAAEGQPPNPVVQVRFEGNSGLSDRTLRQSIEDYLYDLSRHPEREAALYDAADELVELYRSQGYPHARVRYLPPELEREGDRIVALTAVFSIDEGPQVVVDDLQLPRVKGKPQIPDSELEALWSRQLSGLLGLGKALYVETQLDNLATDIERYYHRAGFLDALVQPPTTTEISSDRVRVVIEIYEGPRFEIRSVHIDPRLQPALQADAPRLAAGAYTDRAVQDYVQALHSYLRRNGYPDSRVSADVQHVKGAPEVVVAINGEAGRQGEVAKIVVHGNTATATSVILSRFRVEPGDRYDGQVVDKGLRRLYLTGLFRRVRVDHSWIDAHHLQLAITVEEEETKSIEFLGGYGSYERLRGGIRFDERNVLGTGKRMSLLGRASQKGFRTEATATDPDFLRTDTSLSVGLEYFEREEPSFTDKAFGTTLSFQRTLLHGMTGHVGYTFRNRVDPSTRVSVPGTFVDFTEGRIFLELNNDQRDNPLFPKSGHEEFLLFDVLHPALGASVAFHRVRVGATAHVPLAGDLRAVLRTEQGWLWPDETSADVPLQERFFNGGDSTVRSFREARLGPLDPNGAPLGGEYRNIFSAELRFPIWRTFEGALFADAGNVGSSVHDYGLDHLRYALGGGLRLVLPIGPVRVDAGYNPDQYVNEEEWVVHFSVGYPF